MRTENEDLWCSLAFEGGDATLMNATLALCSGGNPLRTRRGLLVSAKMLLDVDDTKIALWRVDLEGLGRGEEVSIASPLFFGSFTPPGDFQSGIGVQVNGYSMPDAFAWAPRGGTGRATLTEYVPFTGRDDSRSLDCSTTIRGFVRSFGPGPGLDWKCLLWLRYRLIPVGVP